MLIISVSVSINTYHQIFNDFLQMLKVIRNEAVNSQLLSSQSHPPAKVDHFDDYTICH